MKNIDKAIITHFAFIIGSCAVYASIVTWIVVNYDVNPEIDGIAIIGSTFAFGFVISRITQNILTPFLKRRYNLGNEFP